MGEDVTFIIDRELHPAYDPMLYVHQLIAFFPAEGFVAFEGRGSLDVEKLPCTMYVADRMSRHMTRGSIFRIRITESYEKAVPTHDCVRAMIDCAEEEAEEADAEDAVAEKKQESDTESESFDDWVNKRVCFFPNYSMILYRFEVIKEREDPSVPILQYCIDDRFDSVEGLIDTYLSLPDRPEHCHWYEPPVTDVPFFEGYFGVLDKDENMFQAEWNAAYDAIRRKQTPREDHKMVALLQEWKRQYHEGFQHNVPNEHYRRTDAFLSWIQDHLPMMESWCTQYLASMTVEEKLRGWLTYGVEQCVSGAYFKDHWRLFFRGVGEMADVVTLNGEEFDISYHHSRSLLKKMEEEVKAAEFACGELHPGIPCKRERGTFCLRCEEARTLKAAEVYRSYRQGNNVFVNWECGKRFIDAWLYNVNQMTEEEKATIHYVWPPEIQYHTGDIFFSWDGGAVCSRVAFVDGLVSQRQYAYRSFEPREPEDVPRFLHLTLSPAYSLPNSLFVEGPNRWNEVHLFLLRFLSYAPTLLTHDRNYCRRFVSKVAMPSITK